MLQQSTASHTGNNQSTHANKPPSVCCERQRIKELLREGDITIDEAIAAAEQFAAQPGINGAGQQLVATLKSLKPWLLQVSLGSGMYVDFVNRALRRGHARLPTQADFVSYARSV